MHLFPFIKRNMGSRKIFSLPIIFIWLCICCSNERYEGNELLPTYRFLIPDYSQQGIHTTVDSMHFTLDPDTYNAIRSFNVFSQEGIQYISFYDERSQTINIYDFGKQSLVKRLSLKEAFQGSRLYKTTVYCQNFDSIFVNNKFSIYLLDTTSLIRDSISFKTDPEFAWANFENTAPLIINDGTIYAAVRPYVDEKSLKAMRQWKVLYKFDFDRNTANLYYHLPVFLQQDFYGHRFMDHSHCINNHGNFVLSFPADTLLYETNLRDLHFSYSAKSMYQKDHISPVTKQALLNDEGGKGYMLRDSYEAIYFDNHLNRYLRLARFKVSESDYQSGNRKRKQSLIILDENLKIIGESLIDSSISLKELFFSNDGSIFARVSYQDEYAIHFVKLKYAD